jgi:hypothetical protein
MSRLQNPARLVQPEYAIQALGQFHLGMRYTAKTTQREPSIELEQSGIATAMLATASFYFDLQETKEEIKVIRILADKLMIDVQEIGDRIDRSASGFCTFITSLGVPGVSLKKPIPVTIRSCDDGFIASFLDANISIGGDTLADAVSSLQDMIADSFNDLEDADDSTLWPPMLRQKQALLDVVCRI